MQLLFRFLAHYRFERKPEVVSFFRSFYSRLGDTKLIEDSNKRARQLEQAGSNREAKTLQIWHDIKLEDKNTLKSRDIPQARPPVNETSELFLRYVIKI